MSRLHIIFVVLIAFVVGGASGSFAASRIGAREDQNANREQNQQSSQRMIDVGDGLGMTPPEMLDELQKMESGSDFDHRYMNYVTLTRNNEIGMARVAARKAEHQELKVMATRQMEEGNMFVNQMYSWTKVWGFTHH